MFSGEIAEVKSKFDRTTIRFGKFSSSPLRKAGASAKYNLAPHVSALSERCLVRLRVSKSTSDDV